MPQRDTKWEAEEWVVTKKHTAPHLCSTPHDSEVIFFFFCFFSEWWDNELWPAAMSHSLREFTRNVAWKNKHMDKSLCQKSASYSILIVVLQTSDVFGEAGEFVELVAAHACGTNLWNPAEQWTDQNNCQTVQNAAVRERSSTETPQILHWKHSLCMLLMVFVAMATPSTEMWAPSVGRLHGGTSSCLNDVGAVASACRKRLLLAINSRWNDPAAPSSLCSHKLRVTAITLATTCTDFIHLGELQALNCSGCWIRHSRTFWCLSPVFPASVDWAQLHRHVPSARTLMRTEFMSQNPIIWN